MKDSRFVPVENHEPIEDLDEYSEEIDSDGSLVGHLDGVEGRKQGTLYIAS